MRAYEPVFRRHRTATLTVKLAIWDFGSTTRLSCNDGMEAFEYKFSHDHPPSRASAFRGEIPEQCSLANFSCLTLRFRCLQSEELQLLCSLGREAAEILWEMAALQEETHATKEMLEKGEQLQVSSPTDSLADCQKSSY